MRELKLSAERVRGKPWRGEGQGKRREGEKSAENDGQSRAMAERKGRA